MIVIKRKEDCVGCNGCVQVCPKQCISFNEDTQSFRYPEIDVERCIHCNLCEKVCPVIHQGSPKEPITVYAAKNNNEGIKEHSSSGGIFYALAEKIIAEKGVVFGARFNDKWEVEHGYTEDMEGVRAFQTSKYIQSYIGNSFCEVKSFLEIGRKVMFTGTPCQIAGLKLFLRKDYPDQLLTVDIVCHGVPSPGVWREYLDYVKDRYKKKFTDVGSELSISPVITSINFRDKRLGWNKYGVSICITNTDLIRNTNIAEIKPIENKEFLFEPVSQNIYMQGFLKDLYLRPACYECPAKCGKSHADLTLGDFWGLPVVYPEYYKEGCFSLLLVRTEMGKPILNSLQTITLKEATYRKALYGNPSIEKSTIRPKQYDEFWKLFPKIGIEAIVKIVTTMSPSLLRRIYKMICILVKSCLTNDDFRINKLLNK